MNRQKMHTTEQLGMNRQEQSRFERKNLRMGHSSMKQLKLFYYYLV